MIFDQIFIGIRIFLVAQLLHLASLDVSAQEPQIASLDFCADHYVLTLAESDWIAGLSVDSRGVYALPNGEARTLPQLPAKPEPLIMSDINHVVRLWGGSQKLVDQLSKQNIAVTQLGFATNFDHVWNNIALLAEHLAIRPTKLTAIKQNHDDKRTRLAEQRSRLDAISALYITPGGVTAGHGTMIDTIITQAGLKNKAAQDGHSGWVSMSLEMVVMDPPDIIISGFFDSPLEQANHWSAAHHPVFADLFDRIPTISLPLHQIGCAGPASLDAALTLQKHLQSWSPS